MNYVKLIYLFIMISFRIVILLALLTLLSKGPAGAQCAPLLKMEKQKAETSDHHFHLNLDFLFNFGYLDKPKPGSPPQSFSDEIKSEAITSVQKYGGIAQTGILDDSTLKLFKARRCGVPDILRPENFVTKSAWRKKNITYRYATFTNSLEKDDIKKEIADALNEWSKVSPLTFTETNDLNNTDIEIGFYKKVHTDKYPFDGFGRVLAHAFFPGTGLRGDLHFDDDEFWAVKPNWFFGLFKVDLRTVAIHELGHSLGLDHSQAPDSIMNPYYSSSKEMKIGEDDRMAMAALYGEK